VRSDCVTERASSREDAASMFYRIETGAMA
jgi:hypothetical protein